MITFNYSITYLKEPNDTYEIDDNKVLNTHVRRKLLEFETKIMEIGATHPDLEIVFKIGGVINSNNAKFKEDINFDWIECADPEINEQIQLLRDNFFSKE